MGRRTCTDWGEVRVEAHIRLDLLPDLTEGRDYRNLEEVPVEVRNRTVTEGPKEACTW